MPVRQLKGFPGLSPPPVVTPRCCANVSVMSEREQKWRMERYDQKEDKPFQCSRPSVVQIDNKHYCRLHGGHIVLDKYIKGELTDVPKDNSNSGAKAATETTGG
jgi:hypothetical protein